jgi:hypothetical protein
MQGSSKDARLGGLRHRLLRRDIDVLAAARALALVMSNKRRDSRLSAGVQIRLRDTHPHRGAVIITGQDQRPTRREDDEVTLGIVRFRSILAERCDRDIDQGRVERCEIVIAKPIRRECPWRVGLDEEMCAGNETSEECALATRRRRMACPSLLVISSVMLRLFRLQAHQNKERSG